jgi:hypothetical protein
LNKAVAVSADPRVLRISAVSFSASVEIRWKGSKRTAVPFAERLTAETRSTRRSAEDGESRGTARPGRSVRRLALNKAVAVSADPCVLRLSAVSFSASVEIR